MHYLRYKSNITCLLSSSVWAFTPTTFAACKHNSNYYTKQIRPRNTWRLSFPVMKLSVLMLVIAALWYLTSIHINRINTMGSTPFSWSWNICRINCCFNDSPFIPCLQGWPWWSWVSADECWRHGWQEQWFPPATSPDTGQQRAKLAAWSTWQKI